MHKLEQIKSYEIHLIDSMAQCVSIMREIISLLKEEQQAIFNMDEEKMQLLLAKRSYLTEDLHHWREKVTASVWVINELFLLPGQEISWEDLLKQIHIRNADLLKNQIFSLSERIEKLNKGNTNLMNMRTKYHR